MYKRQDEYVKKTFHTLKDDVLEEQKKRNIANKAKLGVKKKTVSSNGVKSKSSKKKVNLPKPKPKPKKNNKIQKKRPKTPKPKSKSKKKKKGKPESKYVKKDRIIAQILNKDIEEYESFLETIPGKERSRLKDRAKVTARGILTQAQSMKRSIQPKRESRVKHLFQMHSKLTIALICCVFLFIGAPMGAIVRKGGFGYPILIAIIFFVAYMVFNLMFERLAKGFVIPPEIAAWCTCLLYTSPSPRD